VIVEPSALVKAVLHQGALSMAGIYLVLKGLKHRDYYSLSPEYCQGGYGGFHLPAKAGSLPAAII
jgi:hypothetical protein